MRMYDHDQFDWGELHEASFDNDLGFWDSTPRNLFNRYVKRPNFFTCMLIGVGAILLIARSYLVLGNVQNRSAVAIVAIIAISILVLAFGFLASRNPHVKEENRYVSI